MTHHASLLAAVSLLSLSWAAGCGVAPSVDAPTSGASSQSSAMPAEGLRDGAHLAGARVDQPERIEPVTNVTDPANARGTGVVHTVTVDGAGFAPASLSIAYGDSVEFVWVGGEHSVTSGFGCNADGMFHSGVRPSPTNYRVTFLRAGLFPFFSEPECDAMKGMIIVKQGA
ncbi:MAG: hypothetical protein NVS3B10_07200 [Polyangiales bacterium]